MLQNQHLEEIKTRLKGAGLTDKQIASYLLDLDARLQTELIEECLQGLTPQDQDRYERLIEEGATPQELAVFLKLDKAALETKIAQKIARYAEEVRRQFFPQSNHIVNSHQHKNSL